MKITIKATIEVDENMWCSHSDQEEFDWFKSLLNDGSTMVILHSNEVGDEIGHTFNFEYEINEDNN